MTVSDAELVRRYQSGDKEAFDEIVLRYQKRVMERHRRWFRSEFRLGDLTQDTFIRALEFIAKPDFQLPEDKTLGGVLSTLSVRAALDETKRMRNESSFLAKLATLPTREGERCDADAIAAEISAEVDAAFENLSPTIRKPALLRFRCGYEPTEIAKRLGINASTVRERLRVASEQLRARLEHYYKGAEHGNSSRSRLAAARRSGPPADGRAAGSRRADLGAVAAAPPRAEAADVALRVAGGGGHDRLCDGAAVVGDDAAGDAGDGEPPAAV